VRAQIEPECSPANSIALLRRSSSCAAGYCPSVGSPGNRSAAGRIALRPNWAMDATASAELKSSRRTVGCVPRVKAKTRSVLGRRRGRRGKFRRRDKARVRLHPIKPYCPVTLSIDAPRPKRAAFSRELLADLSRLNCSYRSGLPIPR